MRTDDTLSALRTGLLLVAVATAAACHRGEPANPAAAPAKGPAHAVVPVDADPVVDAGKRMAAGVPMGNGTAPVEVRFDLASVPRAGQPFEVEIAVLPQAPSPVLRIDVLPGDGMAVDTIDGPLSVEKVQAGGLARLFVKMSSAQAGTHVLGIKVTLEQPGGAESREFAFPVVVGGGAAPAAGAPSGGN